MAATYHRTGAFQAYDSHGRVWEVVEWEKRVTIAREDGSSYEEVVEKSFDAMDRDGNLVSVVQEGPSGSLRVPITGDKLRIIGAR